jgi:hypothetical protein
MHDFITIKSKVMEVLVATLLLISGYPIAANARMPSFEPVVGFAPKSILYDEPGGEYDTWTKQFPCSVNSASVTVKFYKTNYHAKWQPLARIMFYSGNSTDGHEPYTWAAATVRGPWGNEGPYTFVAWDQRDTDGKFHGSTYGSAAVDLSKPVQIEFSWTGEGAVTVSFNEGPPISLPKIGAITTIRAFVSSAKVEFIDLNVGHAGPPGFNSPCVS